MRAFWEMDMSLQRKLAAPVIGLMIAVAGVAWANDQGGVMGAQQVRSVAAPARAASPADALSPGNRLIAEALFAAQRMAGAAWPLERIAASRLDGQNWGDVFQQMKMENLLQAETLGQVVTWYQYNYVKPEPNSHQLRSSVATVPIRERNYGN